METIDRSRHHEGAGAVTRYLRPTSLADAVGMLDAPAPIHLLAGGTDLINEIRLGLIEPERVIDTADLAELQRLTITDDQVAIGAAVTMRQLLAAPLAGRLSALLDSADLLGGRQIQAVATVGGNICHASPAAETATPLLVHDAIVRIVGPNGPRELAIGEFWAGPRRTNLAPGELVVELVVDQVRARWASAYRRIELRHSVDIALVSASAALDSANGVVRAARIAIGAAGPVPIRVPAAEAALIGSRVQLANGEPTAGFASAVAAAGRLCSAAANPITDVRASADYRRAMVAVVVERAIAAAALRGPHIH